MRQFVLDKLRNELWHLEQKTITILGAAFKPGTDDLREAPAVHLAKALLAEGAHVRMWDPVALGAVKEHLPEVDVSTTSRPRSTTPTPWSLPRSGTRCAHSPRYVFVSFSGIPS
jgi:UDP-glucose 6-dehydrogenase